MANVNRGKQFEQKIKEAFQKVSGVSIDRIPDQTMRHKGAANICDFIVYKKPYEYYIECKSVHGNTFSIHSIPKRGKDGKLHGFYGNISDTQWEGLLQKSKIEGVFAGIICWFVDKDITLYIPIEDLERYRNYFGKKSVKWNAGLYSLNCYVIQGRKKRVFFDYNMEELLYELSIS